MPAPAMSHMICSIALITLIFLMPAFYVMVSDNLEAEMMKRELREIANYVSNTVSNLYFLVNNTSVSNASLEKDLVYLPSAVEDSIYILNIVEDGGNATKISAYLKSNSAIAADSWLLPGLKAGSQTTIESLGGNVIAGCSRNSTGFYAWIRYE